MAEENSKAVYKLKYLAKVRARAEPIRLMLEFSGVKYEMETYTQQEWWKEGKKQLMPLGQLPVLDTEYGSLVQTTAICNYVATELGYQPDTAWERAVSDSILISINEVTTEVGKKIIAVKKGMYEFPGEEKMQQNIKEARELTEKTLDYIQKHAKEGAKFIFGDRILVADLMLYIISEHVFAIFPDMRERSEWLKNWSSNMEKDDKFGEYLRTREEGNS